MKPIIEIKNLSAGYDGRTVLHDVNLSIYERDFLGIIGPNGGGKTTLIKCILGLLKPTGGEIIFHTPEKASTKTTSTFLGYLPQYNSIDRKFPISVEEVILSGLSIQKSLTSRFTPEQKEKGNDGEQYVLPLTFRELPAGARKPSGTPKLHSGASG